jgi:ADP-ribose pyrophosphatase YjhB (NUDIX family)
MITCTFENGGHAKLRHVVTHAIVEKNGALLLEKRTGDILETGKWALPAGYLERDETAGEGMLRELYEETGWKGKIISLFRVNTRPARPQEDRQNIVFEFLIEPVEKTGEPDEESSAVEWIPIEKISSLGELAFDHGESVALYLAYRQKTFPLPLLDI